MDKLFNQLLQIYNNYTLDIDFFTQKIGKLYKSNLLLSTDIDYEQFCRIFVQEEQLDDSAYTKLYQFLKNLNPSEETFSLNATFKKKNKSSRYEVRGILKENRLVLTFTNLKNRNNDSVDVVTKVFTRDVILGRIEEEINAKHPFALILLDIDNFKLFNDHYGHMFGDIVLLQTATSIRQTLKRNDSIGRIGGDEFLILIHTENSYEAVHKICHDLKMALKSVETENIKNTTMTATFGCSVFPQDGEDYTTLFKKADKALLRGKKKGRDCFIIYTEKLCGKIGDFSIGDYHSIETIDKTSSNSQVVAAVYEILLRNDSIKNTLMESLKLIGNFFLLERIYAFFPTLESEQNVVLEWIDPVHPELKNLIHFDEDEMHAFEKNLDQTGMLKIVQTQSNRENPIMQILIRQKCSSLLGFRLLYKNKDLGFIRFEMCTINKFWQDADVSSLMLIAKIFAITIQRKNADYKIERQFNYDSLTGVYNYTKFRNELLYEENRFPYAMFVFDIMHFAELNDSYGTSFGDDILIYLAKTLNDISYPHQTCRLNEDHFLLFVKKITYEQIPLLFNEIKQKIQARYTDTNIRLRAGIHYSEENDDFIQAIDYAKAALKDIGYVDESTCLIFGKTQREKFELETAIQNHIFTALENQEFLLYLQPKVDMNSGQLYGAEALSRWNFNHERLLFPNSFIPVLEKLGFINQLDFYIFEKVCQFLKDLQEEHFDLITISVNMSRYQSNHKKYVETIEEIRKKYQVDASYIEIEVTEGMYIDNVDKVAELIGLLHQLGYHVSMDDFGSGYSNLASLAQLQFDVIKLDKSLVLKNGKKEQNILSFIKDLTNSLDVNVLCEGVENEQIAESLNALGYHLAQGYLYDKPLPASLFKEKYFSKKES